MKIAFLNSCLEPGKDGVGDYSRSLAQECVRQGHECRLVALNDRHVSEPTAAENGGLSELRLPSTLQWPRRIAQASEFLDAFVPDWVSLQFVPYAFHPKGFVHGLGRRLQPLVAGRRVHLMFHELWLGEAVDASRKDRLIGAVQKRLVLQLLKRLRPRVVHTSNCAYVNILQRNGVSASRLPMFGSIPITADQGNDWLLAELWQSGLDITSANRDDFWLFGFFGALHPVWPPEPFFRLLGQAAAQAGRRVVVLSAGQIRGGEALWQEMEARYSPPFTFQRLGPQPSGRVSQYFNMLDAGIATSPVSLVGKSSSAAAMLEHGLPVIVNRSDAHFAASSTGSMADEPLLHKMDEKLIEKLIAGLPRGCPEARLPRAASQFLASLQ